MEAEDRSFEATPMATFTPETKQFARKVQAGRVLDGGPVCCQPKWNRLPILVADRKENYCDRNNGTLVGEYQATAEQMYFPYVRPQENGHHTDTRWLMLKKEKWQRTGCVWMVH